jgi:hypothetical protein
MSANGVARFTRTSLTPPPSAIRPDEQDSSDPLTAPDNQPSLGADVRLEHVAEILPRVSVQYNGVKVV